MKFYFLVLFALLSFATLARAQNVTHPTLWFYDERAFGNDHYKFWMGYFFYDDKGAQGVSTAWTQTVVKNSKSEVEFKEEIERTRQQFNEKLRMNNCTVKLEEIMPASNHHLSGVPFPAF